MKLPAFLVVATLFVGFLVLGGALIETYLEKEPVPDPALPIVETLAPNVEAAWIALADRRLDTQIERSTGPAAFLSGIPHTVECTTEPRVRIVGANGGRGLPIVGGRESNYEDSLSLTIPFNVKSPAAKILADKLCERVRVKFEAIMAEEKAKAPP